MTNTITPPAAAPVAITKRILINATQTEELRVAIVNMASQELLDLLTDRQSYKTKTGNIYMATITAIEPSLDACFVNFGSERHGFLPFKEIAPHYLSSTLNTDRPLVKDSLKEGQKLMVQVEKEERGNKGAALTTFVSLAGSYLVLMPNNPRAGGISRRVEGGDRDELREILSHLPIPDDMGLIIRTAGVGKATEELQWDLNTLLKQWEAIQKAAGEHAPPFLIHQESDVLIRAIRDYLREDVTEILVDHPDVFERIKNYLAQIRPDFMSRVKLYSSQIPLFNRYQIEHQIEAAHEREVRLPSGGSIVIGHTEALVAIDVNSGQATKGKDIEQTALEINKEAARIIACQLRIRDIGGLVVIDFIDMPSIRHRREVENELRNALKLDKARTQIGTISSRFGLLEMSRQRLRHSLGEATRLVCSRCDGWGSIRSVESLSLSIIRVIEEDAIRPGTQQIQVQLPVDIATFIINEKRTLINQIEKNHHLQIIIIPNQKLESPHYRVKRLTEIEAKGSTTGKLTHPSYRLVETGELEINYAPGSPVQGYEEKPAVKSLFTKTPSESDGAIQAHIKTANEGLVKRLIKALFGGSEEKNTQPKTMPNLSVSPNIADLPQIPVQQRSIRHNESRPPQRSPAPQRNKTRSISAGTRERTPRTDAANKPASNRPRSNSTPRIPHANANTSTKQLHLSEDVKSAKTAEALQPPEYLKTSLSDAELENYYQEGTALTNRKPAKKEPLRSVNHNQNAQKSLKSETNVTVAPDNTTLASHPKKVLSANAPLTTNTLTDPIVLVTTQEKNTLWVPHKVSPAAQTTVTTPPKMITPPVPSMATETTPPQTKEKPIGDESH